MKRSKPGRRPAASQQRAGGTARELLRLPRTKRALLIGASGLALAAGGAGPALALNECGAASGVPPQVFCFPGGNPFPNGIVYQVTDLTIVVTDGVIVDNVGAPGIVSGGGGNFGDLVISAGTAGGIGVLITTNETAAAGIYTRSGDGSVTITSFSTITTKGTASMGLYARAVDDATVVNTGDITSTSFAIFGAGSGVTITSSGTLTTSEDQAAGILGYGAKSVTITSTGAISTAGVESHGIYAANALDGATITINATGPISTQGDKAAGILVHGDDAVIQITNVGDIDTLGKNASAIAADSPSATGAISITSTGSLTTSGDDSRGIYAAAKDSVTVVSDGDITTTGTDSTAIFALSTLSSVTVSSTGSISAGGSQSGGITTSGFTGVSITSTGDIATAGDNVNAITGISDAGTVTIKSTGGLSTKGTGAEGIFAQTTAGAIAVTSDGDITTANGSAILTSAASGGITIDSTGDLSLQGSGSGIFADASADALTITSSGDIATAGTNSAGIRGYGGAVIISSTGDVSTTGSSAYGFFVLGKASTKLYSTGDVTTTGAAARAIAASSDDTLIIVSKGDISTAGAGADGIVGVAANSLAIDSFGDITTAGTTANGLYASSAVGTTIVHSSGTITTTGDGARGINASGKLSSDVTSTGDIQVSGFTSRGILSTSSSGPASVTSTGDVSATGDASFAILAFTDGGAATISQTGDVAATGADSRAIVAISTNGAAHISLQGNALGGSGNASGIAIDAVDASTLDIAAGGSVGALNDIAILGSAEDLTIVSDGTITGFLGLSSGNDVLRNLSANSLNLRDFADTDGDGVRDIEGVAIADFGADTDSVENVGTLRLASVSGATTVDTTGQITHPGGGNADITQDGVEQGFLTNLETFDHRGLITLQDGVAGDLLVITDQADGATAGNNVFTSNGGRLALDVVLDDGSSKQSDVLVLDKALTGTGATRVAITNAGGAGGQTKGDGILVVNVRTDSDDDAFALAGPVVMGAYQYELFFQNEAKTDENWYLRSSVFEGTAEYPAIVSGALMTWYSDLGVLHERLGERRREVEDGQTAALPTATDVADASAVRMSDAGQGGWFRMVGADMDIEQDGAADFDLNTVRAEAGFDVGFDNVLSDDWLVLGAFAGYGWSPVAFESDGNIDFDIATVGAYATYFRGPYYLDALVKFDWLDGDYHSLAVSEEGDVELPVFGLSLETGYRFDLTPGGLYLQPQAQLTYAHAGSDSLRDDSGEKIELNDADSLRGRLGARLGQELPSNGGAALGNFYLEASVNQEFLGETEAKVSGLTLVQELPDTTFEVGAGFDIALPKDGVSFTIDADYIFGEEADGVAATGGVRLNW